MQRGWPSPGGGWKSASLPCVSHVHVHGFTSPINEKDLEVGSQTKTQLHTVKAE